MRGALVLAAGVLAAPCAAQETANGDGVVLRALDKIAGVTRDVELPVGATARFGRLEVDNAQCRYPLGNPAGDAFALLRVREAGRDDPVFTGWMIASAPGLNPLDHQRYDVWVLRCMTS